MESSRRITRTKQLAATHQVSARKIKRISKLQRAQNPAQIREINLLILVKVINREELVPLRICYYQVSHLHTINVQISKSNSIQKSTRIQAHAGKVI